jgi:hypothetical protein
VGLIEEDGPSEYALGHSSIKKPIAMRLNKKGKSSYHSRTLMKRAPPSSFLPLNERIQDKVDLPEMKMISQPKGVALSDLRGYTYRVAEPYSTRIYIIDSGVEKSSEVSTKTQESLNFFTNTW